MTEFMLAASEDAPSSPAQKTPSKQRCSGNWQDLPDESQLLPINQAVHRLASLLQADRGAWPLIDPTRK